MEITTALIKELREKTGAGILDCRNALTETSGDMGAPDVSAAVQLSLDLAKLGGLKDIVPVEDVISTRFKPVPTKP